MPLKSGSPSGVRGTLYGAGALADDSAGGAQPAAGKSSAKAAAVARIGIETRLCMASPSELDALPHTPERTTKRSGLC